MMKNPLLQLIFIALISGLLWRLEIEYHGWASLNWISYFHWAIPASALLFLAWANKVVKIDKDKRIKINVIASVFVVALFFAFKIGFTYAFAAGPFGMLLVADTPEWQLSLLRNSLFFLVPLMPIGIYIILKIFGQRISIKHLIVSIVSMIIAIPFSIFLLKIFAHKGGADLIHIIKSGVLMPLWILSFGMLVLVIKRK